MRIGAPLAQVSHAPRGPPCRSIAMSNRRRGAVAPTTSRPASGPVPPFGDDDDFVEMGVAANDRRGQGLDDVSDVSVRVAPPQRAHDRRREHYVADESETNKEDPATCTTYRYRYRATRPATAT